MVAGVQAGLQPVVLTVTQRSVLQPADLAWVLAIRAPVQCLMVNAPVNPLFDA